MEVILLEKITNLGDLGDTVKVKSGYGRNFLLPKGKALPANDENRKVFEARKAELVKKAEDSINAAKARAEALAGKTLVIEALASEEGKLYGSISATDIAHAAEAQGLDLQRSEIDLPGGPIRQVGSHPVHVRLHSEVEIEISIEVAEQKGTPPPAE